MYRIEERTRFVKAKAEKIFRFLSDMNNFGKLLPAEVENWKTDGKRCSFYVRPAGNFNIEIAETLPFRKVQYRGVDNKPFYFDINADIRERDEHVSELDLYINAKMNAMTKMLAGKALQKLLARIADELQMLMESGRGE